MSTIESAPEERLPIKTYVSEFSDELIREAILREMDRQGQVYFLHNRVYNIEYMSEYIRTLVPDAKIGIAHGQMSEKALEKSMIAFSQGETDVLLCTTIIESGLDIANANTLIVNRADSFGLAQLYQLRGRIGRSSKRGYSYLLIPKSQTMTESAERRLKAMLSATELGSGFKIAMKDLEIRGAGNILGSEQSGHIHAVGFELYTRLLATAVEDLRSQDIPPDDPNHPSSPQPNTVSIDLGIPTGISEDYIEDLPSRLDIYQKLIQCRTLDETDLLERELKDRFGPLPWQALNLLFTVRLKIKASLTGMEYIRKTGEKLVIQFPFEVGGMRFALQNLIGPGWTIGNMQIRSTLIELGDNWEESLVEVVEKLGEFQSRMSDELIKSTAST
jgi:transcription-repair coupling factor (superfamily II helicase)